jgi:hypothetical protein
MKFINKTKLKERKFIKNKNLKRLLFILTIFFLGILTERFEIKHKIYQWNNELLSILTDKIIPFQNNVDKIVIDLKYKNYQKIKKERELSINSGRANEGLHNWVPANISFNNEKFKVKIKLKGVHSDHWSHPKKWSFKIKLLNNKSIGGFKRFSIQEPRTRNFLYEWLFMKTLKYEGLIYHRSSFSDLSLNGDHLGIYYLEEFYSKQLIENNKRREGPIIGLDKDLWIEEVNNKNALGANFFEDSFWRAKIKPIQFKKDKIGSSQEIYLKEAISLFENFRSQELSLDKVFDLEQLSKLMAIQAIFGSSSFDWRDIKFYYNPITSLLEPIGTEISIKKQTNQSPWWLSDNHPSKNIFASDQNSFIKILVKDNSFYKLFLSELNRMTNKDYIQKIIKINKEEFDSFNKLMKLNYPTGETFSLSHFDTVRNFVTDTLNPIQNINAFFLGYDDDKILLSIHNLQSLPIKISHAEINDDHKFYFDHPIMIEGKKYNNPPTNHIIKIKCNKKIQCGEIHDKKIEVFFNILGQNKLRSRSIEKFYKLEKPNLKKNKNDLIDLSKLSFVSIDNENKTITFKDKIININSSIVIPENFTVNFLPGTEIIFSDKGHIISYSNLNISGTNDNPIIFRSNFNEIKDNNEKYGYGILVLNTKKKSIINNAIFKYMNYPDIDLGYGLMGAINFYNSDVIIKNSEFFENLSGDDYLNIINSNFDISNVKFINSKYDSIDLDFSQGIMENVYILNAGNDGIDFSGSDVKLKNIFINTVGDKGLSAGEKSKILIENLNIKKANIGIASKDLSTINVNNFAIQNSKIIAAAYQKKSEYGPGYINVTNISHTNNTFYYFSELNSQIVIDNELISVTNYDYSSF